MAIDTDEIREAQRKAARAELARRELNRRESLEHLLPYVARFEPGFDVTAQHSKIVCEHLEALDRGDIERLMIFMPPQHGKSLLASETFPAWWIGRRELEGHRTNVALTSYGASKAYDFSRRVRAKFEDPANPFPATRVDPRSSAVDLWGTVRGSHVIASGVGGPLTGFGVNLLGIDDPVKDAAEAFSRVDRDKKWQWYLRVAKTRLRRRARMFMAQTRWHQKDLAGMILDSADAKRWTILTLPAICEDPRTDALRRKLGEVLWPGGPEIPRPGDGETTLSVFRSMYQQQPTPDEGLLFKRAWFQYATLVDGYLRLEKRDGSVRGVKLADCRRVQMVDLATSLSTKADYFVIESFAITPPPYEIVTLDVVRGRFSAAQQLEELRSAYRKWLPSGQGIEDVGYQLSFFQLAVDAGLPVQRVRVTANKEARAMVAAARYENGTWYHLRGAQWLEPFESELLAFPTAEHDDQVDPTSMVAQVVSTLAGAGGAPQGVRIG